MLNGTIRSQWVIWQVGDPKGLTFLKHTHLEPSRVGCLAQGHFNKWTRMTNRQHAQKAAILPYQTQYITL